MGRRGPESGSGPGDFTELGPADSGQKGQVEGGYSGQGVVVYGRERASHVRVTETNLTRAENGRLENNVGGWPGWGVRNRITEACEVRTEDLRLGGVGCSGELLKHLGGGGGGGAVV